MKIFVRLHKFDATTLTSCKENLYDMTGIFITKAIGVALNPRVLCEIHRRIYRQRRIMTVSRVTAVFFESVRPNPYGLRGYTACSAVVARCCLQKGKLII